MLYSWWLMCLPGLISIHHIGSRSSNHKITYLHGKLFTSLSENHFTGGTVIEIPTDDTNIFSPRSSGQKKGQDHQWTLCFSVLLNQLTYYLRMRSRLRAPVQLDSVIWGGRDDPFPWWHLSNAGYLFSSIFMHFNCPLHESFNILLRVKYVTGSGLRTTTAAQTRVHPVFFIIDYFICWTMSLNFMGLNETLRMTHDVLLCFSSLCWRF